MWKGLRSRRPSALSSRQKAERGRQNAEDRTRKTERKMVTRKTNGNVARTPRPESLSACLQAGPSESKRFPEDERYSLTSQIRRSLRRVAANIAEGFRKRQYPNMFGEQTCPFRRRSSRDSSVAGLRPRLQLLVARAAQGTDCGL